MTKYHLLVAFALTLGTIAWGCRWERQKSIFQGVVFIAVMLLCAGYTSLFFETGQWVDGLAYHKPAVIEMKSGWNPVWEYNSERDQVHEGTDASYRWWLWLKHFSKSDWYINAVFYAFSGNLDLGNISRMLYLFVTFIVVFAAIASTFRLPVYWCFFFSFVATLNPFAMFQCFISFLDGALGSCLTLLFFALAAYLKSRDKRFLPFVVASIVIATNLKFTGVVYVAVFLICMLIPSVVLAIRTNVVIPAKAGIQRSNSQPSSLDSGFRRSDEVSLVIDRPLTGSLVLATVLALIVGINPYLYHLYHHYTPFYPLHIVRKVDEPDRLDIMKGWQESNVSDANKWQQFFFYYLNTSDWHPAAPHHWEGKEDGVHTITVNKVPFGRHLARFCQNFGGLFMISMWFSLLMMPLIRRKEYWFFLLAVWASIWVQPHIWCARYIPHLWLIPIIVACALLSQFNEVPTYRRQCMIIVGAVLLCMFVSIKPFFEYMTPGVKESRAGAIAYFIQKHPDALFFDTAALSFTSYRYSTKTYISDVLPNYSFKQPDERDNNNIADPAALSDFEAFIRKTLSQEFDEPKVLPLGMFLQVCPVYLVANNQRELERLSSIEEPSRAEMTRAILHLRWQQFKRAWGD